MMPMKTKDDVRGEQGLVKQSEWEAPLGQSFRIAKPLCSRRVVDLYGVLWAASAAARYQILMATWCGLVDCEQRSQRWQ
jgi:hypothetical protein